MENLNKKNPSLDDKSNPNDPANPSAKKPSAKKPSAKKKVKVRVLEPLWGKFNLPYGVGQSPSLDKHLADEIILSYHGILEEDAKKLDVIAKNQNQ